MRVTGVHNQTIAESNRVRSALRQTAAGESVRADESASSCRALIPLSPVQTSARVQTRARQPASFLAHLIATQQSVPQTRERRRIEPSLAAAIYAAAGQPASCSAGRALSRAM